MKVTLATKSALKQTHTTTKAQSIEQFYDVATEDYKFWSSNYNMHFGYSAWGCLNPFIREGMLTNMNRKVFDLLSLNQRKASTVIDLGCGMGGSMKYGLSRFPKLSMLGVTLSDFQVEFGNRFINKYPGLILKEDFNKLSMNDGCYKCIGL